MLKQVTFKTNKKSFPINIDELCKQFSRVCLFDSNKKENTDSKIEHCQLLAIGSNKELKITKESDLNFQELHEFVCSKDDWKFGYITYDAKNSIENLSSTNDDFLDFSLLEFFIPKFVFEITEKEIVIHYNTIYTSEKEVENVYKIAVSRFFSQTTNTSSSLEIKNRITKDEYLKNIHSLKNHIQKGDIYEVNFCHEFYAESITINPYETFLKLNEISQAPFAAFCKFNNHYVISSSPERFIKKTANKLISQPIKGTAKRSLDKEDDLKLKHELKQNPKEQNENIMIVDLVRNDLSKIAKKGTVKVDELFGVYSFKQVHQMISTVSCEIKENITFSEIIKSLFPMGSMTGAPKVSAMQLIEQHESTKRGLYSGCLGYIKPNGDFDFNVIIRTILYNTEKKYVSFMVGSAITAQANPEFEYDECILKAYAMKKVFE